MCLKKPLDYNDSPGLYTPQGSEKDLKGNMAHKRDQGTNVKLIGALV